MTVSSEVLTIEPVPSIKMHRSTPFSRVSSSCNTECMSDALTAEAAIPLPCSKMIRRYNGVMNEFRRPSLSSSSYGKVMRVSATHHGRHPGARSCQAAGTGPNSCEAAEANTTCKSCVKSGVFDREPGKLGFDVLCIALGCGC